MAKSKKAGFTRQSPKQSTKNFELSERTWNRLDALYKAGQSPSKAAKKSGMTFTTRKNNLETLEADKLARKTIASRCYRIDQLLDAKQLSTYNKHVVGIQTPTNKTEPSDQIITWTKKQYQEWLSLYPTNHFMFIG